MDLTKIVIIMIMKQPTNVMKWIKRKKFYSICDDIDE